MSNPRPGPALQSRRLAVVLALLGGLCSAKAAPDLASPDPVMRLLVDKGLVAESNAADTRQQEAAGRQPAESRFVDRFRDTASEMVLTARNFLGVRYRRGGNGADDGFDCSGFTRHVFAMSLGLVLPRRADDQAASASLLPVERAELQPGDLVFFNTMRRTFSHVGIYIGAGRFIHSPKPGGEVRVDDLQAAYWDKRFTGGRRAGRFVPAGSAEASAPTAN